MSSLWVLGLQPGFWEEWAEQSPHVESSWARMGSFLLRVCSLAGHLELDPNLPPVLLPSIPGCSWLGSKSASCRLGWARHSVPGPHLTCQTPFPDSVSHHTSLLLCLCNLYHPPFLVSLTFQVAEELVWRDPSSVRSEGAGQRGPEVGPSWGKWGFCWVGHSRPGTACGLGWSGGPRLPTSLGLQEE